MQPEVILPFSIAAVIGVLAGSRIADRVTGAGLQRAFAALLAALAVFITLDTTLRDGATTQQTAPARDADLTEGQMTVAVPAPCSCHPIGAPLSRRRAERSM